MNNGNCTEVVFTVKNYNLFLIFSTTRLIIVKIPFIKTIIITEIMITGMAKKAPLTTQPEDIAPYY
jgi:hypothetical protein